MSSPFSSEIKRPVRYLLAVYVFRTDDYFIQFKLQYNMKYNIMAGWISVKMAVHESLVLQKLGPYGIAIFTSSGAHLPVALA